ncbi:MAG TPA: NAD-binding protein, partial [Thermoanaerobaculia bacterium]
MPRSRLRVVTLLAGLAALLVLSAFIYMVGMDRLEGKDRDFWQSLAWAGETLSTTGYGADASWAHPLMVLFVVVIQFAGVFLVFLIIPIFLVPYLEQRFEERLPRRAREDLRDHVIVYRFSAAVETLLERLAARKVPHLVVELDEEVARRLHDDGIPVLLGRRDEDLLDDCRLAKARALIANGRDEENGALILKARQMGFAGDIYALVEVPEHRKPMEIAGATAAYTPRHILAAALAARASDQIAPRIGGLQHLRGFELREFRIPPSSAHARKPFEQTELARAGIRLAGQWSGGKLLAADGNAMLLEPGAILLLVGEASRFETADDFVPLRRAGPYLVAGFGVVGRKVRELLTDAGESVVAIDRQAGDGVTIVGNVLDVSVLRAAGIEQAQAVILALDTDDATLFATVIIRDISPRVPVIARVNKARNVENIHRAGADFALSISQVSGQLLAYRLLHQEALSLDERLKVLKSSGLAFAGKHPSQLKIRERTQCSIVAIERGSEVHVEFPASFRIESDDTVFVCGSEENVRRFTAVYVARD